MADCPAAPDSRLTVLRVKRKRHDAPQDTIIVEEHAPVTKRLAPSSSGGDGQSGEAAGGAPARGDTFAVGRALQKEPAPQPPRRQRFRRVDTVPVTQGQSEALLQRLLSGASRAAVTSPAGKAGVAAHPVGRGVGATSARAARSAVARYMQVRRRRAAGPPRGDAPDVAHHHPDPVLALCRVYDVDALPMVADADRTGEADAKAAARAARTRDAAAAKAAAAQEQRLMCNYVPMLKEVLRAQGVDVDDAAVLSGRDGQQSAACGTDDEYVFDVYTAVDDDDDDEEDDGAAGAGAGAGAGAHQETDTARGDDAEWQGPVLWLYDPDDEDAWTAHGSDSRPADGALRLVSAKHGALDTLASLRGALHDGADSDPDAAEVDYPDDEEDDEDDEDEGDASLSDDDDDGSDVWVAKGRTMHVWQPRRRGVSRDDEEEYDTVAYEEHEREEERFRRWAAASGGKGPPERLSDENELV